MATAGRILIMPKGTWNAETTYENLDMVAHSGRAWLAKKTSVGIEPSDANAEFWHDFLGMDVFTEENPPTAAQVGALSLNGGTVIGDVYAKSFESTNTTYTQMRLKQTDNNTKLVLQNAGTVADFTLHETIDGADDYRGLRLCSAQHNDLENALVLRSATNGAEKQSVVFGQHNKPNGSYTGNGSATRRYVEVGGISQAILIRKDSADSFVIVTSEGALVKNGASVSAVSKDEAYWYEPTGTLQLNSANVALNESGKTYYYCVL